MQPVYADFTANPPRLGNGFVVDTGGHGPIHHGDHVILGTGAGVTVGFQLDEGDRVAQVTLGVTALASKRGPGMGHAPLTIAVNGRAVVERWTIPGGGDLPQDLTFAVPGDWLLPGQRSTVEIRNGEDAATYLWLYRITLEEVFDRGAAARAMAVAAARESVFTYRTEHRPADAAGWTGGPELRVYVDRGEQSLPAQLSWSRADGSEIAISFQSAMDGFSGYLRAADGATEELQGQLAYRSEFRDGALGGELLQFETEEGWGGGWHRSGRLRLAVADGGPAPLRVTWRDQRGNSGSISLPPERDGFLGYYQRHNEGPIGYRGRAVEPKSVEAESLEPDAKSQARTAPQAGAESGDESRGEGESLRHELEEIGRHAQIAAERVAELMAGWRKPRR
jgi:hypothetical protein